MAEKEGVPDFVVWGKSSADLGGVWRAVKAFLATELRLVLKPNVSLNRTAFGMDFLGYRVFPQELRLARRRKLRFARKFRRYEGEWASGRWTDVQLQQRMQALVAFTLPARSRPWRRHCRSANRNNNNPDNRNNELVRCFQWIWAWGKLRLERQGYRRRAPAGHPRSR